MVAVYFFAFYYFDNGSRDGNLHFDCDIEVLRFCSTFIIKFGIVSLKDEVYDMWRKPVVNELNNETLNFTELNAAESLAVDGGDWGWLGTCAVPGSACSFNGGGLAWGVCVCLGISYRKNN